MDRSRTRHVSVTTPFVENAPEDEPLTDVAAHYLDGDGEFLIGFMDDGIIAGGGFQSQDDCTVEIRHMRVHPEHQ